MMLKLIRSCLLVSLVSVFFTLSHAAQVDINSADASTIALGINGIGPSKAQAIVDYRELNGPFSSVDELVQVQGIGSKTIERIREFVTLSPVAGVSAASPSGESSSVQPALQN